MTRHLRRLVPSPAMVVALTALFLALGGSAYAALVITGKSIRNNTLTTKDIRNGTLQSRDHAHDSLGGKAIKESALGTVPSAGITFGSARFAVVTADGILARGRSTVSVAHTSEGRYQVIFNSDVRGCAYFASVGDTSASPLATAAEVTTASLAISPNGVAVRTFGANGTAGNRPFHLIVSC
jgi:hypothetical protein